MPTGNRLCTIFVLLCAAGCSSSSTTNNIVADSGTNTGGKATSGGMGNAGGTQHSGGTKAAGGNNSVGGTSVAANVGGSSQGTGGNIAAGGTGGCGTCSARGLGCCNGSCVNLTNDINNCGTCGTACTGTNPFCNNGTCGTPPCTGATCGGGQFCCGGGCCTTGQLCCNVPGPVTGGPQCATPVNGTCPVGCPLCVCASPDTPIATPRGARPIVSLREGDLVFSVDHGRVVTVPVLETKQIAVSNRHVVVRVALENGSVLEISAPHPTADGRRFSDLRTGGQLGGIRIAKLEVIPYRYDFTYDILPASDSGTYFAGGVLVGSTLAAPVDLAMSAAVP